MISILIPTYEYDVRSLVDYLIEQVLELKIAYEIIVIDDASPRELPGNHSLSAYNNVHYFKLSSNIGRSKIRNLLASKAAYDWCLFLDADVYPYTSCFLQQYVKLLSGDKQKVYSGGVVYERQPPDKARLLRWKYGINREEVSLKKRLLSPYRYFFGANFLIHRSVFSCVKFSDSIVTYGYEDLLFAEGIRKGRFNIQPIDNPVIHQGIEVSSQFLKKTRESLVNLKELNAMKKMNGQSIGIIKAYRLITSLGLTSFIGRFYLLLTKLFECNLKSAHPSLFIFDLYKISYFCHLHCL